MLIRSSRIPKQHMHKKENMLLLVIPSQSHFYTHTKYEIETSEDKQAPPQKNQQEWSMSGSKTRQKQLKMIEPHTLTNLCKLQCLDQDATLFLSFRKSPFSLTPCHMSSPIYFWVHFLKGQVPVCPSLWWGDPSGLKDVCPNRKSLPLGHYTRHEQALSLKTDEDLPPWW